MNRLPLSDQVPYRFIPPKLNSYWVKACRPFIHHILSETHRTREIDMQGVQNVTPLLDRGDGVLIAPNHPDDADCGVMFELGNRIKRPFFFMAAYQIFSMNAGLRGKVLSRLGVFPVDREGTDLASFKTGVDVLVKAKNPLVIFPEGEIYFQADRLTPLREGAVAVATTAAKRLADSGKTVWIVPAGIKYRFLDGDDPLPGLATIMDDLETRFNWRPFRDDPLIDRIYRYAVAMISLKEIEFLGAARPGTLADRIAYLRDHILDAMEDRRVGKRRDDPAPVRVKELRRCCLELLAAPATTPEQAESIHRDLQDLFLVLQLFTYRGDYVKECPTVERASEIMMKLEQDVIGVGSPTPRGPRRAILRLGEPIDVGKRLAEAGKSRVAIPAVTAELEERIQALLDAIGPGRLMAEPVGLDRSELQTSSANASPSGS